MGDVLVKQLPAIWRYNNCAITCGITYSLALDMHGKGLSTALMGKDID